MRKRGTSLVELLVGMTMMGFVLFGICGLFVSGLLTTERRQRDTNMAEDASQGLRYISERLQSAMSITIPDGGRSISYTLPQRSGSNDAVTGERELVYPPVSDGVTRTFSVNNARKLIDSDGNRVLVRDVATTDPKPGSTQYNQTYPIFQLTTVGSRRAVSINLITSTSVNGEVQYVRMKTTVLLRNAL